MNKNKTKQNMIRLTTLLCLSSSLLLSNEIDKEQIDINKKAIALGSFYHIKDAKNLMNKFSQFDTIIKKTTTTKKPYFVVFAVNLNKSELSKNLKIIQSKLPTAYITSDSRVHQLKKPIITKQNIIDPIHENNIDKNNTPNNQQSQQSLYNQALVFFNAKDYQSAIPILSHLLESNNNNIAINFYLANSYFELHQYALASNLYEKILTIDKNHLRSRLELAESYLLLGHKDESLVNFKMILEEKIPLNVALNIKKRIEFIENSQKNYLFFGYASVKLNFDNNINNTSDTKTFSIPNFSNLTLTDEKYNDIYSSLQLDTNFYYKLNNKYTLENNLNYLKQNYQNESKKNLDILSYSLNISNYIKKNIYTYGINLSNVLYANQNYYNSYSLNMSIQKKYFSEISTFSSIGLTKKNYNKISDQSLNSNSFNLILGHNYPKTEYGDIDLIYIYNYEKFLESSINSNQSSHSLILSRENKLINNLYFNQTFYSNIKINSSNDSVFLIKRDDNLNMLSLGLNYKLNNSTSLLSNIKYINNKSNIDIYSYSKQLCDISLVKKF